jgi:hypothetical protein
MGHLLCPRPTLEQQPKTDVDTERCDLDMDYAVGVMLDQDESDHSDAPLGSQTRPGYVKAMGTMDPGGSDEVPQNWGRDRPGSDPRHDPQFEPQGFGEPHPSFMHPD